MDRGRARAPVPAAGRPACELTIDPRAGRHPNESGDESTRESSELRIRFSFELTEHEYRTKVNVADSPTPLPHSLRVRSHQIELHALDYGNPRARPMLLFHGMRDLAWSLDSVAQAFRARYRVISLDLRGHGDSSHVGYYALSHFIIDVRQILRALAIERPILVGHSFGGEVVTQYAGLFPEVPAACVLIEGMGPPPWEGEGSREAGLFWARSAIESLDHMEPKGTLLADLDAATERILRNHPRIDPGRARFLAERGTYLDPEGGRRWKWDPFLRTSWGSFNFGQIELCWRRITCPVLAVNGGASGAFWSRDPGGARRRAAGRSRTERGPRRGGEGPGYLPREELERRLACFKDIEATEIPGAGHMVHFDEPAALNAAIAAFLERRRLS